MIDEHYEIYLVCSGIGYKLVQLFASDRYNLVLVPRIADKLKQIANEFTN
jgi:short-subunit dehydrogenase